MAANIRTDGETVVISFPTWFSMVDYANDTGPTRANTLLGSRQLGTPSWYGSPSFGDAFTLAEKGWEQGAKRISSLGEAMFDDMSNMVRRPEVVYSEDPGISVDIARYVDGEPDCWVHLDDHIKRGASRQIVRLVFNGAASSGIPTDIIMAKGAVVAALVMLLEYTGAGVEVVCFQGISENFEKQSGPEARGKALELYTTVKLADAPVDVLSLAYALAHPSTFRRFGFAIAETLDVPMLDALDIGGSYGFPCEASHQGDLYIPASLAGDDQWTDAKRCRQWVLSILKEQGVAIF